MKNRDTNKEPENDIIPIDITDGIVILGKRGSGKTELIKYLMVGLNYPALVVDVVGNLKSAADKLKKNGQKVQYFLVNPHDTKRVDEIFGDAMQQGNLMAYIDEADRYEYFAGVKNRMSDYINLARNYGCGYIATARRTADISPDYLANAKYVFVFRHLHPRDIKVLTDWLDVDEKTLRSLDDHEFIVFKDGDLMFISKLEASDLVD